MNAGATILVVEDHHLYREALTELLRVSLGGEHPIMPFASAEPALQQCLTRYVGLILLDNSLPGTSGMDALHQFRRCAPAARVVMLSGSSDIRLIESAAWAGAAAYASKAVPTAVLVDLLRRVMNGQVPTFESVPDCNLARASALPLRQLSGRQHEVLRLLADGRANKEIGRHLGLAEITIKLHVSAILKALEVKNRTQATVRARQIGLLN